MNSSQLRWDIIEPTLHLLDVVEKGYHSANAVELLIGTCAHESHLGEYIRQVKGPALGIYQVEPETHQSIWEHYLRYRPAVADMVRSMASSRSVHGSIPDYSELIHNLQYATAIARIVYRPAKTAIPDTLAGQAEYWDANYNKNPAKGFAHQYIADYQRLVGGKHSEIKT